MGCRWHGRVSGYCACTALGQDSVLKGGVVVIEVQQGTPGSGKSAVATARAMMHLRKGGVVAANFSLVDHWAEIVASKDIRAMFSSEWAYNESLSLYKRFYRVDSLAAIRSIEPHKESVGLYQYKSGFSEGEGLLILDEAQLIFNSRKWEKNFDWIEFFTQHRKLHWNVILIAHTIEMIDGQVRPLCEYASTFRNLQKVKVPFLGVGLAPYPTFVVITRYAGLGAGSGCVASRNLYPLPLWAANLYDSMLVFSAENWGRSTEPSLCGMPPTPPCGVGGARPDRLQSKLVGPHWDDYLMCNGSPD